MCSRCARKYFTSGDRLSDFRGTFGLGLGFEKVLKPVDHECFVAVAQRLDVLGQPFFAPSSSGPIERFSDRIEMLPGVMKVQGLDGGFEAVIRQIPEPNGTVHDQGRSW